MFKEKKKNKFITCLCACLMAVGSLFSLVGSIGNTLAYTPSKFTTTDLDTAITQINSSLDFKTYFDGYFTYGFASEFYLYGFNTLPNISYEYYENDNGVHFDIVYNTPLSSTNPRIYANTSGYFTDFANIEYIEYFTQSGTNYYRCAGAFGGKNGVQANLINIALNKIIGYNSVITIYVNGQYYNFCSLYMLKQNESYLNSYDTNAYEEGYNQGLTEGADVVLDNPNDYGLYTEEELNQNYDNGYIEGIKFANQGFLLNSSITIAILYTENGVNRSSTSLNYVTNSNNIYVLNNQFFTDLSTIQNNVNNSLYAVNVGISDLSFVFNEEIILNVINPIGISSPISFQVQFGTWTVGDSSYRWYSVVYNILPIISDNQIVNYEITYNIPSELYNKRVYLINYSFGSTNVDIPLSQINNFALYDKNVNFNNGYELGYIAGTSSDVVKNAYDEGYETGNRVGYQTGLSEGLNNENRYTFLGLLTGVVQAPVNVMKDLFNFELMGFNMLNFFLGCLTAVLILWLIRKVMGGK